MQIYFPIKHRSLQICKTANLCKKSSSFSFVHRPSLLLTPCRSSKPERNDELQAVERQVEKYRDVLQIISKKVSPSSSLSSQDPNAREKRLKKIPEYLLGQAMEESAKELPDGNSLFRKILDYCGECESPSNEEESQPLPIKNIIEMLRRLLYFHLKRSSSKH